MTVLTRKSANELLEAYARQFGEPHLLLAMHAAVPLGLAPEMLHLIRINFIPQAPWIAEADLLLSTLCREAGDEMYQLKPEVREGLLGELKLDSEFGMRRVREVAGFLYAWTERELNRSRSSIRKDFLKAQQLAAIAWLEPKRAAQLIAAELQNAQLAQSDSEIVRLSKLTEQLAEPLMNEDDLLLYVAGMNHIEGGKADLANAAFAQLGSGTVSIAGADLSLPQITPRDSEPDFNQGNEAQSNIGDVNVSPDLSEGINEQNSYQTDIYVSCVSADESGQPLRDTGNSMLITMMIMFDQDLRGLTKTVMGMPSQISISMSSSVEDRANVLSGTAVLLILYSRSWLQSEAAQLELQQFLESNRERNIREGAIRNRIILLPLEPVDLSELPTELRHCAQLPLFVQDASGNVQLTHRESTGELLERYRKSMNDLANLLVSQYSITQNKVLPPPNQHYLFSSGGDTVFLSDASEDTSEQNRRLADQFRANGFQVLPGTPLNTDGANSLVRYLVTRNCAERSSVAVLIVGEQRREMDISNTDAIIFDNDISVDVSRQTGLPRFIWAPGQEDINLGDNPDAFYGAEVIRGSFDDLLRAIETALPNFQSQNLSDEDFAGEQAEPSTYDNNIYLSYFGNRYDEEWVPFRDKLIERFGEGVVSGKEKMAPSGSIGQNLQSIIEQSNIVLAMIGPYWLQKIKNANADVNKLESYEDWLLFEIMEASRQQKYIIPVLYGLDAVPTDPDLPPEIQKLSEVEPLFISGENAERDIEYALSFVGGYLGGFNADFSNVSTSGETSVPEEPKRRVFMAYWGRNSEKMAQLVREGLAERLENVQMDSHIGSITLGQTAREFFKERMEFSSAVLVFIDKWFDEFFNSDGDRLIDDHADWLRVQIEVAYGLGIPIFPILVNGAGMPTDGELPEAIHRLITTRQAIRMDEQYFADDIEALARAVNFAIDQSADDRVSGRVGDIRAGDRLGGRTGEEDFVTPSGVEAQAGTDKIYLSFRGNMKDVGFADFSTTLEKRYSPGNVINKGTNSSILPFEEHLRNEISSCSVFIALIGNNWLQSIHSAKTGAVDTIDDWLLFEIEEAFKRDKVIIPVLYGGVEIPDAFQLPQSIRRLPSIQAVRLDTGNSKENIELILERIDEALIRKREQSVVASAPDFSQGNAEGSKNIFLSMNTGTDMTGHMRAALGTIKRSGHRRVEVLDQGSTTIDTYFQDLEDLLKQTDMFILVLGERLPLLSGSNRSIIEEEYEVARRVGVQTRILLPPPTADVKAAPGSEIDRLQEFRHQLEGENPVFFYQSPEDIEEGITGFIESEFGYPEEPIQQQATESEENIQQQTIDPVENIPQQQTVQSESVSEEVYFHPVDGSEYILIPGGRYTYSVTNQTVQVPDRWFGMYPVTIEKYQSFLRYLQDNNPEAASLLPVEVFIQSLNEFARRVDGMAEYLYGSYSKLAEHLEPQTESRYPSSGDDHPVTGISWYAARIYCFWLGMLEDGNVDNAAEIYSLPSEEEWEWAASGGEREYPWPNELGEPTEELANFGYNLGETSPVDAYPNGATPQALMDMAGNVWEWCANRFSSQDDNRTLRGGAFHSDPELLRCSARNNHLPHDANNNYGFRVVRREPPDMS